MGKFVTNLSVKQSRKHINDRGNFGPIKRMYRRMDRRHARQALKAGQEIEITRFTEYGIWRG